MNVQDSPAGHPTRDASSTDERGVSQEASRTSHLQHVIEHAGHFLPAQGPITVFVHHNTLHAFEELPFDEAVVKGSQVFGCQPYLSEERFRSELDRGRIQLCDLKEILRRDLGNAADATVARGCSRFDLRLAMLQHPLRSGPAAELHWFVAETDALTKFRADTPNTVRQQFLKETRHWVMRDLFDGVGQETSDSQARSDRRALHALADLVTHYDRSSIEHWSDETWAEFALQALWRICRNGVHGLKPAAPAKLNATRHRDLLLAATGEDSDRLVHDVLIRFCGAFLDQGFAPWSLPVREAGLFGGFCALYGQNAGQPDAWLRGLTKELQGCTNDGTTALQSISASLEELGIREAEWEAFITATLLGLRGWAGMIREIEIRADRAAAPAPQGSLIEFLAVYLLLERRALRHVARKTLRWQGPLDELREAARLALPKPPDNSQEQRAFTMFQLAQVMGWMPVEMFRWSKSDWATLVKEVEAFSELERRRIFHQAYERRYYTQSLDAISIAVAKPKPDLGRPGFQAIFCLDEREESFRRHIEELAPDSETFGAAGFFSVAMYYRGAAEANFVPLCPVIVVPQHWVEEDVVFTQEDLHRRRAVTRKALGKASHQVHLGSRTIAGGALLTAGFGVLASIPLVARVLFPRLTARIRRAAGRFVQPPKHTNLLLERSEPDPGPGDGHIGFTVAEMTNIAERLLRDIGLTRGVSRIVIALGHGSNSLNNPHNSAYNCGACGGGAGGPNARALAQIMNDPRVREQLAICGLPLPEDTIFIGAYHNTCDDSVTYHDLDRVPKSHQKEFARAQAVIEEACNRNAHERCRRFVSAPLNMSFGAARRHVENRAEDLAQTRPECGHATNALTIVARRQRTRGLYMDRRAFLTSYDPTQDDAESTILTRILGAVFPVCGGISLEYYFSYVDSSGWGCSTKLPHNVSGLIGVMDGPASDLRPGLPWQMVEIHEPVRSLFIIETTPAAMLKIMERNEGIGRLARNGWVQLATLSPTSDQIHVFRQGKFELYQPEKHEIPTVQTSVDWYRGWRDHLGCALVKDAWPRQGSNGNGHGNGHAHGAHHLTVEHSAPYQHAAAAVGQDVDNDLDDSSESIVRSADSAESDRES